jgi:hypothetical protein
VLEVNFAGGMDIPNFNIFIFVGICNLPFYAISMNGVSLFPNLSFLFLAIMNLYYIDVR